MRRKITNKHNWETIYKYEKRFLKQKPFPPLPRTYENKMQPILHTGYLMFIRSKFLFLGMIKSLKEKNEYTFYSLAKSYWENIAAFGYYYLRVSDFLTAGQKEEAFKLARQMGLGGRKFPTEEIVKKTGRKIEEYTLPNIYTMMDKVDKDMRKRSGNEGSILREIYDEQIAEGGHTTYTGLAIARKWSNDKRVQFADLKKGWVKEDKSSLLNLAAMSSLIFFIYWDKFEELRDK